MKDDKPKKPRKKPQYSPETKLVFKIIGFLTYSEAVLSWPKEIKIAKKLLSEFSFLRQASGVNLKFKPKSLVWYLTEEGRDFLKSEEVKYTLVLKEKSSYDLETELVGENKEVAAPKTSGILNFIRKYEQNKGTAN